MIKINRHSCQSFNGFVERIWSVVNDNAPVELMVPPNQYVNIIIPLKDTWYRINDKIIVEPQIEGVSFKSHKVYYPSGCRLIGVRFFPYGARPFFSADGSFICNKSSDLSLFISEKQQAIIKQIQQEENIEDCVSKMNSLLDFSVNNENLRKLRVLKEYYQYFRAEDSPATIDEFCTMHHTNYTTLNRYFHEMIGISPKRFERLIKFRKALCKLVDSNNSLTEIGAESGYFDQAHFIREFKLFLDCKPMVYHKLIKEADKETQVVKYNFRLF